MLEVCGLSCGYGGTGGRVLNGIDLDVKAGEIVVILGSNGAGKSTLLRAVIGLIRPVHGEIRFRGRRINEESTDRITSMGLVLVPENRALFGTMSVQENLELGGYLRDKAEVNETLEMVYGLFPVLRERKRQSAATLSGGEQQMLAIGRALMTRPSLLMLDEPSLGLAPLVVDEIYRTLVELNSKRALTLLVVEQDVSRALDVADRIYVMENGRVVFRGKPEELTGTDILKRAYFGSRKEKRG
ncbi:ABC transporter ATP-binding protein [Thermodesulforhabdus norvegica]|uniref:Amino acid/amide ABC transporter ATP-binding protein 2, HAAT family (TC 3.A.1.4.-) n=1 Tax=Thermodesulforhabdus norvegica TaxID=39841 RepID=A0A1I4TZ61_9BACT|nr:ABC transporter ATP-binding protein [Thermodesulforhabdus norvegica]SFM82042.1 amino acid/amide ABC transporter ATP-binding protein 2, HAAT family (TC 3.A.1.4.-) [Thermodesulforhabdus norvegica]